MDSDKLITKYRLLKVLFFFLDLIEPILKIILIFLFLGAIVWTIAILVRNADVFFIFCIIFFILLWVFYAFFEEKIKKFIVYKHISGCLIKHFMRKWNTNENQLNALVNEKEAEAKRKEYKRRETRFIKKEIENIMPFIQNLNTMNIYGQEAQKEFLKDVLNDKTMESIFNSPDSQQINRCFKYWRKKELSDRRRLVNYLFKYTIVQDGIHLDEWNFMFTLMSQFKFNEWLHQFYRERYFALRTEFEESETAKNQSYSKTGERNIGVLSQYYATLGLTEGASDEEIKKAYRALALQHHPDLPKNADRVAECEAMMTKINEAYEKIRG